MKIANIAIFFIEEYLISYWDSQKAKISLFYQFLLSMKSLNQAIAILIIFSQGIILQKNRQKYTLFNWSHLKNGKEDVGGCKPPRRNTCCSCKWIPT